MMTATATMAWTNRTSHTTEAQRRRIMARDNRECQIRGPHCEGTAAEVDHIDNTRGPDYDTDTNLQAVCKTCHKVKTRLESSAGLRRDYRDRFHPREQHPGRLRRS